MYTAMDACVQCVHSLNGHNKWESEDGYAFFSLTKHYKIGGCLRTHVKVNIRNRNLKDDTLKFIKDNCCIQMRTLEITNWTNETIITVNLYKYSMIAEKLNVIAFLVLNKDIPMNLQSDLVVNVRALCRSYCDPWRSTFIYQSNISKIRDH